MNFKFSNQRTHFGGLISKLLQKKEEKFVLIKNLLRSDSEKEWFKISGKTRKKRSENIISTEY